MHFKISALLFTGALLFVSSTSQAIVELRLHYGANALSNLELNAEKLTTPMTGAGADLILNLPAIPIGFGLRYEQMGLKTDYSGDGITVDIEGAATRASLLLNYRFINTLIFLGPVATIGLSHSAKLDLKSGTLIDSTVESKTGSSYSVGVEAGIKVPFLLGVELGMTSMKMTDAETTDSGSIPLSTEDDTMDLTSTYAKLLAGFSF